MKAMFRTVLVLLAVASCASRFDAMTAEEHLAEARALEAAADRPEGKVSDVMRAEAREHRAAAAKLASPAADDGGPGRL